MSKTKLELEDPEKKELIAFFSQFDKAMLKTFAESIAMLVRAFDGRPVEPDDIISRLTNVKELLERSRFPTYPLLAKQVYLRLIAKYHPEAISCEEWADLEAHALIEYKGEGRSEYVEMTKHAALGEGPQIYFGERKIAQPEEKRHFWQRRKKSKEKSEFTAQ